MAAPIAEVADTSGRNFLELYGDSPLRELFGDWQERDIEVQDGGWANFPPQAFLDFCRNYPATPFDQIPPSADYLKDPSYLISQSHRLWSTASLVFRQISGIGATSFIDLGSFPFVIPIILRDFFKFEGRITATTNLTLAGEGAAFLERKGIAVELLDLDPFVRDPGEKADLPTRLSLPDQGFDVALSSHVIEHLYHPKPMVREAHRLLRAGGKMIITTDNAMMVDVLTNFAGGYGYIFEPIRQTAAMHFNFWRGHVRFFTAQDLQTLVEDAGFSFDGADYYHCFYDKLFEDYFRQASPRLPGWKARMLEQTPWLRNDVAVVATRS